MKKIYFVKHPTPTSLGEDKFVAVTHGETGYNETTVYNQAHATTLNEQQGLTPAMVDAAETCSMFDIWPKFDEFVEKFDKKVA